MPISRVLIASSNRNKVAELGNVGGRFGIEIVSPPELAAKPGLGVPPDVEENGATFQENALIKAEAYLRWGGMPTLGDDSGLEVEILDSRPGIFSARYGGPGLNDADRIQKLLKEVRQEEAARGVSNRRAAFVCSLVLLTPEGGRFSSDYRLAGTILDEPRGSNGFGYDPIVLIDELGKTLAEVDFEITCTKGFRARAAEQLFRMVGNSFGE